MADRLFNPQLPEDLRRLSKLFRVKATEIEMMEDQGYTIQNAYLMHSDRSWTEPIDLTPLKDPQTTLQQKLEWRDRYGVFLSRHTFTGLYYHPQTGRSAITLYLNNEPGKSVKSNDFTIAQEFIGTGEIRTIILITRNGLHSGVDNFCKNQVAGYDIRVFLDTDLAFNRTKHAYAPISTKLISQGTAAEREASGIDPVTEFARTEGLEPRKLPLMLNSDFMAKYYGAKPGDIMQVEIMGTETDTAGFYRSVHQAPPAKK